MIEYSEMTNQEWLDHVEELNEKARKAGGLVDVSNAVIFRGTGITDAKVKIQTPREAYIDSLKLGKGFGVLTDNLRAENEKAVLSGIRGSGAYVPINPAHPEN